MKLPWEVKKCVFFIGLQMADKTMKTVGTGFLVMDDISKTKLSYLVTAKHILNGIASKGLDVVYIRMNLTDGTTSWIPTKYSEWKLNADINVDVCILRLRPNNSWDHMYYALSTSISDRLISEFEIDVGDEVFIIGLFTHHHGKQKNIPIARIGNIAAMKDEKIQTTKHLMDAYLIEARSIGGLSGSPVFISLGDVRFYQNKLHYTENGRSFLLIGLIYGHYDVHSLEWDEIESNTNIRSRIEKINTGIAIVTPVEKILETIQQ